MSFRTRVFNQYPSTEHFITYSICQIKIFALPSSLSPLQKVLNQPCLSITKSINSGPVWDSTVE